MTIYELKLNEDLMFESEQLEVYVLRVPGGWVYIIGQTSAFVPFNNEFQKDSQ